MCVVFNRKAPSYYDLLGIAPDAPLGKVKQAYRKLAREIHPDRNPDMDPQEVKPCCVVLCWVLQTFAGSVMIITSLKSITLFGIEEDSSLEYVSVLPVNVKNLFLQCPTYNLNTTQNDTQHNTTNLYTVTSTGTQL